MIISGGAATIADNADVAEGSKSDAAWVFGDGTTISLLKKIATTEHKTIKSVAISTTTAGDNVIVAAVTFKRLKVIGFGIQSIGTVNVKWKDGAGTDLTGSYNFAAREGIVIYTAAPGFIFGTSPSIALVLNLSAAVSVVGVVTYFDDDMT